MKNYNQETMKKLLAIMSIAIIVVLIGHVISTVSFNSKVHTVKGNDESKTSYLSMAQRDDSTSSWVKRDYDLHGKKVDLKANTIDGTFFNKYSEAITSWKLRINIKGDCFINNAWCGTVEIHQFTGTKKEAVQKLDLRNYKLKDVKLEKLYDGDLLIPLKKGDYIIYYPSEKDDEIPIRANSELTIGTIFYYLNKLDLSDYEVRFQYHKAYTEGIGFYAAVLMIALWLGLLAVMKASKASYRKAIEEMEIRMSGIKYMEDIYDIIYQIDLENDELEVLVADEVSEKHRPKHLGARDQLLNLFMADAEDAYLELMLEFADTSTLNERLTKESIVCNYLSKFHGWSQIRFIAMDREEGQPIKKVLFTIQNIHEEKDDLQQNEMRISKSESEKKAKSVFFDILADHVVNSVGVMEASASAITAGSAGEAAAENAEKISNESESLMQMTDKLKIASELYAGTLETHQSEYSFSRLVQDIYKSVCRSADESGLELITNISADIPERLYGDSNMLRQITIYLLTNSISHTDSGTVTFAIFGSRKEEKEHLLISIKDTGRGISEKDLKRLTGHWAEPTESWNFSKEEPGIGLTMIHELLRLMGSGLQIISEYGEGSEFYFELEQDIADTAPAGRIELG